MPWIEFHVTTLAQYATEISDKLILLGAQAVTMRDAGDQPIYEPDPQATPIWQDVIVIGLFDGDEPSDAIIQFLEKQRSTGILKNFELHRVEDEDWTRRCLDSFKPMQFGKRLWICPSWITPPDPNAVNVILDPGLAFGTGTHPTTALCLEWLDKNIQSQETIIDYGCGSGILAIAALKLGAKKVLAIDHDEQALLSTHENAKSNHINASSLETFLPNNFKPIEADILIANILAQPLIMFAPLFAKLVKLNGKILLSGILKNQVDDLLKAYNPWFYMEKPADKEGWIRLIGNRK